MSSAAVLIGALRVKLIWPVFSTGMPFLGTCSSHELESALKKESTGTKNSDDVLLPSELSNVKFGMI